MELQMKQSCQTLSTKIKTFEKKYIDHYVSDSGRYQECTETLNELKMRQRMIDEIKQKVSLYKECVEIMKIEQNKESFSCFDDFESLEILHSFTLKLWTMLDEWRKQKDILL